MSIDHLSDNAAPNVSANTAEAAASRGAGLSTSRRGLLKQVLAGGGAAATASLVAACTSGHNAAGASGAGDFASTPKWRFVFVNHVTTNSFFVPTRYGLEDAASLLGITTPQWTGS